MGKVKRYCTECGSRLEYEEVIKNRKVPAKFDKRIYHCNTCSVKTGRDTIIGIIKLKIPQSKFYQSIDAMVFEEMPEKKKKKKGKKID